MVIDKLKQLRSVFFITVLKYSVVDIHLHLVLRASLECVDKLPDEQVMRFWATIHPPLGRSRRPLEVTDDWLGRQTSNAAAPMVSHIKIDGTTYSSMMERLENFRGCLFGSDKKFAKACHQLKAVLTAR